MSTFSIASTSTAYPEQYECGVLLRNCATQDLRPIRHADAAAMLEFHQAHSTESVYLRFLAFPASMPQVATRLTDLDTDHAFGLVGESAGTICAAAHYFQ